MNRFWLAGLLGLLSVNCGTKSVDPVAKGPHVPGIALPREISALPATGGATPAGAGAPALVGRAQSALLADADSDYALATTVRYVDERAVSQFEILNTIFGALHQTHYEDQANVNQGPYGTLVGWMDDHGGQGKQLKPWVVDSRVVQEDGKSVNVVQVWMKDMMDKPDSPIIKAELRIYQAPAQAADGTYTDYGLWRLNVKFGDDASKFFAAQATHDADGLSVVMLHQAEDQGDTRGILKRSAATGYGLVSFPDGHDGTPVPTTVAYVYDANHVALLKDGVTTFKDRLASIDLVNRYALFDAVTGEDVAKAHKFGFPIRVGTQGAYGSYGAWQGRHQLWAGSSNGLPPGTTVFRADVPGGQGESYTTSPVFKGTLVKRTLAEASLQDVKDLVVQTWTNQTVQLTYDAAQSRWNSCFQVFTTGMPSCSGPATMTPSELASYAKLGQDPRQQVWITPPSRIYPQALVSSADGTIYLASPGGPSSPPVSTGTPYAPQNGDQLFVSVNGPIYIVYDGTAWKQKAVIALDLQTQNATFGPVDAAFTLDQDREYYINNPGANYVVKRTLAGTTVKIELQSAANPSNAAALASLRFRSPWDAATYRLVADPGPSFLKLVDATSGQPVQAGLWGLDAYLNEVKQPEQYNWDYPADGQDWGSQQFLIKSDGSYLLLDDPIRLQPLTLADYPGRTFSLQFDGSWISGLPDVWNDLQASGYEITPAIEAKLVTIPNGTLVVDAGQAARQYRFKQLQVSEYLATLPADPGHLDLSLASGLSLASVPSFVEHGMGSMPDVPVKYTEGNLVP